MNWKIRIKNKIFWLTIIPAVLLLARQVLQIFGIDYDFSVLQERILAIVESVFAILAILGIVTDLTTDGIGDSERAMTYTAPYKTDADIKEGDNK